MFSAADGAPRLGTLGAEVETACAREDLGTARALLPALDAEFDAFRTVLMTRVAEGT